MPEPILCVIALLLLLLIVTIARLYQYHVVDDSETKENPKQTSLNDIINITLPTRTIPFFYNPPFGTDNIDNPFDILHKALDEYKSQMDNIISSVQQEIEVAQKSEWMIWPNETMDDYTRERLLSSIKEDLISSHVESMESDGILLQKLLRPFHITYGLPQGSSFDIYDDKVVKYYWEQTQNERNQMKHDYKLHSEEVSSYDSGFQVITHIVRDYSHLGRHLRKSLYSWCIETLIQHEKWMKGKQHQFPKGKPKILVPGAGLGRLARDISLVTGYDVEANEISIVMSAAAYQLLNVQVSGFVHPFVLDFFSNEVNSDNRDTKVHFPDNEDINFSTSNTPTHGALSYTMGDFVETYARHERRGTFDAVVTCFFIDTATNIYEYLMVIKHVLIDGGIWLNVGPLHHHQQSKLRPATNDLRKMIEAQGFQILMWDVDKDPINYRHDDREESSRSTKYEAYFPLRFVCTLPRRSKARRSDVVEGSTSTLQKVLNMREMQRQRPTVVNMKTDILKDDKSANDILSIEEIE